MSVNLHKKYYDYIQSKIRFEKKMEQDKLVEITQKKTVKLPRFLKDERIDEEDEHEIYKSLCVYIRNDEFMEKQKKLIQGRNVVTLKSSEDTI